MYLIFCTEKYSRETIDYLWNKNCEELDMDLTAALVQHIHANEV